MVRAKESDEWNGKAGRSVGNEVSFGGQVLDRRIVQVIRVLETGETVAASSRFPLLRSRSHPIHPKMRAPFVRIALVRLGRRQTTMAHRPTPTIARGTVVAAGSFLRSRSFCVAVDCFFQCVLAALLLACMFVQAYDQKQVSGDGREEKW